MFFVYIIYSKKFDRFYVGMSSFPERRLNEHNSGKVKSTKSFLPWEKFYIESCKNREEARQREKYLKSAAGRKWRKRNLGH